MFHNIIGLSPHKCKRLLKSEINVAVTENPEPETTGIGSLRFFLFMFYLSFFLSIIHAPAAAKTAMAERAAIGALSPVVGALPSALLPPCEEPF